jgi:rod shape-determining protein MreC
VTIQPSGQRALIEGDNSAAPPIEFIEAPEQVRPGDRVISSGDGGVFPAGLLVGRVAEDPGGQMRVRLAADFERLEYLRVLRQLGAEQIRDPGTLIEPQIDPEAANGVNLSNRGGTDG